MVAFFSNDHVNKVKTNVIKVQSVLICRFRICKCAYLLKVICNPKSILVMLSTCTYRGAKSLSLLPAEVDQGDGRSAFSFQLSHRKHPSCSQFSATCLHSCAFCWWFPCFKQPLSAGPKCCPVFLTAGGWDVPYYTLDKLPLAMSYGAVGHEFKVNERTIYAESGILQ